MKKPPLKPWPMPSFKPYKIDNWHDYGQPNFLPGLNTSNAFAIFGLFFIEDIMDKLVEWTNEFAELHQTLDKY